MASKRASRNSPLSESDLLIRARAAERVKKLSGDRFVSVGYTDWDHSLEPWVVELSASAAIHRAGEDEGNAEYLWAFCPLHQRPTSAVGQVGVEIAHTVVAHMCPGLLVGIYHTAGFEQAELWAIEYPHKLGTMLRAESSRLQVEVAEEDIALVPGATKRLKGDELRAVLDYLTHQAKKLEVMDSEIQEGKLPMPGRA